MESRAMLAALPWGADVRDTGEFMLGTVLVTPVFMESVGTINTSTQDVSTEDWTPELIAQMKLKIEEGLGWWSETLATQSDKHTLEFQLDYTYADDPVETLYEPIRRVSNAYADWTVDFLDEAGFNRTGDVLQDIWDFNHAQRLKHDTNWAFTIFVVNSTNDLDGSFARGGSFQRAFAFAGGRFFVVPSTRPTSSVTHETGHMFWALDEYLFSADWDQRRGYYNTQNLNAVDGNPNQPFVQEPSIMTSGSLLDQAYENHVSPESTLAMVGWQDSDGDGIFDVLDVPHSLEGRGYFDASSGVYRFRGQSAVGTLPNLNPSGNANDITINRISRAEYRIDGGSWQTAAEPDAYSAELDLSIAVPGPGPHTIEIRTVDATTGVSSPVFSGTTERPTSTLRAGINGGVWNDADADGEWDNDESGLSGVTVQVVGAGGDPLALSTTVEPDDYPSDFQVLNDAVPGVTFTAIGSGISNPAVISRVGATSSTGQRVFAHYREANFASTEWTPVSRNLQMHFDPPISAVRLDAIGVDGNDFGRLEIRDANYNLLDRYTTGPLDGGQVETMEFWRDTPDIHFAVASSHNISAVRLDNLVLGPDSSTSTDADGVYRLPSLPEGTYDVRLVAPPRWDATAPDPSTASVPLAPGQALANVDFGGQLVVSPWQNPGNRYDVNDDGVEAPQDVLQIINDLNSNGARTLLPPSGGRVPPPYVDVTGDGVVAPNDVLTVINRLNSAAGGESPGSSGDSSGGGAFSGGGFTSFGGSGGGVAGEGERAGEAPDPDDAELVWLPRIARGPLWESLLDQLAADVSRHGRPPRRG